LNYLALSATAVVSTTGVAVLSTTFVESQAVLQVSQAAGVASVEPFPPHDVNDTTANRLSATNVTFFIFVCFLF
jgi:hypothetical protein